MMKRICNVDHVLFKDVGGITGARMKLGLAWITLGLVVAYTVGKIGSPLKPRKL